MAEIGTRSGEDAFKLDAGDHILIDTVTIFAAQTGVKNLKTGSGNHRADFDGLFRKGVVMVDGLGDAGIDALVALGADPAGQAALGLRQGLFLVEADAHFLEVRPPIFRFHVGVLPPGNLGHLGDIGLVGQPLFPVFGPAGRHVFPFEVAVDGNRRFLAGIDGLDHGLGTGNHIAAGKDAGDVRGEGYGIDIEVFPLIDGNAACLRNEIEIRFLADGGDQGFTGHDELRALDLHGTAAAARVRLAQFHAGALHAGDLAVLADHPLGGHEEFHLDALFQGLFDLFG